MKRVVEPEILDQLPAEDPRARRSRRDLRRINFLMGNVPLLARVLGDLVPEPPRRIVELGSGDGTAMLSLARRLSKVWPAPTKVSLLDMRPVIDERTLEGFRKIGWMPEIVRADLNEWIEAMPETDLIVSNLFLHHFRDEQLRLFFERFAPRVKAFASCDPKRWLPAYAFTKLLWAIGCNDVTRHDARVSVKAGFRDSELSALWPPNSGFRVAEAGGYASQLFFATKR